MVLTDRQITLVLSTFKQIIPIAESAGMLFYNRLFRLDPSLRSIFPADMTDQNVKLLQMVGVAAARLKEGADITAHIRALGARHAMYGVRKEHYDTIGEALLWALQRVLGDEFTPEIEAAWLQVYAVLKATALEGAGQVV